MTATIPDHEVTTDGQCPVGGFLQSETPCKACPHPLSEHSFHTYFCLLCECPNYTCPLCGGGVYL